MASPKASGSGTAWFRSLPVSGALSEQPPAVVLLTGFGPFPGVARNASADLVAELARLATRRHDHLTFVAAVLPVDWRDAPARLAELMARHRPIIVLHFGVSPRATGFVIEQYAYNATAVLQDETGRVAGGDVLVPGDRLRRSATLPVRSMVRALQAGGYPAVLSSDPGRYLCNAVLFHSLRYAARSEQRLRCGFIHIPATLAAGPVGETSLLGWTDACEGGLRLMDVCLATLRLREAHIS